MSVLELIFFLAGSGAMFLYSILYTVQCTLYSIGTRREKRPVTKAKRGDGRDTELE